MANNSLTILRTYAQKLPTDFPPSILFSFTPKNLTVYDAFPKSLFHFLILPRFPVESSPSLSLNDLRDLRSLLACDKNTARDVLTSLNEDASTLKIVIETEMEERYGFKWPIWIGFHGTPSMVHLHLHVLSADLCSPKMKNKKHFNSFHPQLGFFLHMEEVLSWLEAEQSIFDTKRKLDRKEYEELLKEPLYCWRCEREMKNMPQMKEHLQGEWEKEAARAKARNERKRKRRPEGEQVV